MLQRAMGAPGNRRLRLVSRKPGRGEAILLGALPFALLLTAYIVGSELRLAENPDDKLLPSLSQMGAAMWRLAFEPELRSGQYVLWSDTWLSLWRLLMGMGISLSLALVVGIPMGLIPHARSALAPFTAAISLIPPITILPILFIVFGLDEASKVMLIVVGTAPVLIRATAQAVSDIPTEQIVKALTLGASTWQMILRVVTPQIMPKLVTSLRLSLAPAWIFLISAEAIASTGGLGYRIFLVRRYLSMDVILPYVMWITLIAFLLDRLLHLYSKRRYGWAHLSGGAL